MRFCNNRIKKCLAKISFFSQKKTPKVTTAE